MPEFVNPAVWTPCTRSDVSQFIKLAEAGKLPNGEWLVLTGRNGRGDYGKTQEFQLNGAPVLLVSMDGARQDTRYYAAASFKHLITLGTYA